MQQTNPPKKLFQQISTSSFGDHVCGIDAEDSTVHCWGDNIRGQTEPQEGESFELICLSNSNHFCTDHFIATTGSFVQVTPGLRTTCGIRDNTNGTSVHCWGGRTHELMEHIKRDDTTNSKQHYHRVSLGKDHACAISKVYDEVSASSASLKCWWLAGSDFDAHKVPVGLAIVA